jgi:nitroreductase
MNSTLFDFLSQRRSIKPDKLVSPGPTPDELSQILTAGTRVPDHKKLSPWRFIVFEGEARARIGDVFADACAKEDKSGPSAMRIEQERSRFLRSPMVIAVISSPKPSSAPEWEQVLSTGAVCYNTCLAANALGFGTCWITEWIAYSATVAAALQLGEREKIAGFLYIGRVTEKPDDRDRPNLAQIVSHWPG